MNLFEIGEVVGCDENNPKIQIIFMNQDSLEITAKIVYVPDFWSKIRLTGKNNSSEGFVMDEKLDLVCIQKGRWTIAAPSNKPWFILRYSEGMKDFIHYR